MILNVHFKYFELWVGIWLKFRKFQMAQPIWVQQRCGVTWVEHNSYRPSCFDVPKKKKNHLTRIQVLPFFRRQPGRHSFLSLLLLHYITIPWAPGTQHHESPSNNEPGIFTGWSFFCPEATSYDSDGNSSVNRSQNPRLPQTTRASHVTKNKWTTMFPFPFPFLSLSSLCQIKKGSPTSNTVGESNKTNSALCPPIITA